MPFSQEALQTILDQNLAAAGKEIDVVGQRLAVLPAGVKLSSLEQYQPSRSRFRGQLKTSSLKDFVTYCIASCSESGHTSGCFVDQDEMAATAILDLGDAEEAGHGDHQAHLQLKPTAAYTAVLAILGKGLSQQQLAEWLEDWLPNLEALDGDLVMPMPAAINAVRKMTIKATSQRDTTVGDFSASRSSMDEIEARSQDTLPTAFLFKLQPYADLAETSIRLRLSVITGRDEPLLKLRWVGEELQKQSFAEEFKGLLDANLGDEIELTLGKFTLGA